MTWRAGGHSQDELLGYAGDPAWAPFASVVDHNVLYSCSEDAKVGDLVRGAVRQVLREGLTLGSPPRRAGTRTGGPLRLSPTAFLYKCDAKSVCHNRATSATGRAC